MAENVNSNFSIELQKALNAKQEWFNTEYLQEMLSQYRLLHSCVKNLNEFFIKKSLIIPDPYRLDKRISDIVVPESSPFPEADIPAVFGSRFSDYETMLDFICTYFRFSVENIDIVHIKSLLEFNKVIDWENLSLNHASANTRAFVNVINQAKKNATGVILSMLTDSQEKSKQAVLAINKMLNELASFQKELYKGQLRKDLFEHPNFNKEKAYQSPEAELAEIKRLYVKVIGKKPFYNDLINEIIQEDQGADKLKRQQKILDSLKITGKQKEKNKKAAPNPKELVMSTVLSLGALAPTLLQIHSKLHENFGLLFAKKKNFLSKLVEALKKAFSIPEKEQICMVPIKDQQSGSVTTQKVVVSELLAEISKKERIYNGIAIKGPEYSKIEASGEDDILMFVNKQITENQAMFTVVNALDSYFKSNVEQSLRPKVKGLQIELSAMRNSILNANKKRGEYTSLKEEIEQMKKLGITENE